MAKNDFCMNRRKKGRRVFSQKTAVLLSFSIFLTGIVSLAGIYFFVRSVMEKTCNTTGMYAFAWKTLIYFIFLFFIILGSLIKAGFEMQREMDEIL